MCVSLSEYLEQIIQFSVRAPNWDDQESDPPTFDACKSANGIVAWLVMLGHSKLRIVPSRDGGLGVNVLNMQRRGTFHCEADGSISYALADTDSRQWEVIVVNSAEAIRDAVQNVSNFIKHHIA